MSALGDFFKTGAGQQAIGGGINTLLGVGGGLVTSNQQKQNLKAEADIVAKQTEAQIKVAQLQLQQAQLLAEKQSGGAGGNTMLYVGLGIGAVVILGVVIYAVTRSKSE